MKNISFISPFCDLLKALTSTSILDRAKKKEIINYNFLDLFSFSDDIHRRSDKPRVVFPTPDGKKLDMKLSLD